MVDEAGLAKTGKHFDDLCNSLAKRLYRWDWTDMFGEPMEQPRNNPDVLRGLTAEELVYLATLTASPMTAEERKKVLESSGASSATGRKTARSQ